MPIRPEHVFLYPIDWKHISHFVRFVRAKGCCEHCGRRHNERVFHLGDGRWWDAQRLYWRSGQGRRVRRPAEDILTLGRWTPVVLACAHLHHDPSDSRFEKLAALCQRCHMIHDAPEHRRRRWMNAHYRRALGDLFYGPYPLRGADWITPTPASMLDDPRLLYQPIRNGIDNLQPIVRPHDAID